MTWQKLVPQFSNEGFNITVLMLNSATKPGSERPYPELDSVNALGDPANLVEQATDAQESTGWRCLNSKMAPASATSRPPSSSGRTARRVTTPRHGTRTNS
jgi:hypothetical protein